MNVINQPCPAKINLGLRILGRRDDGFHDILSIFQTVGLFDALKCSIGEPRFSIEGIRVPADHDNLVMRAACAFNAHYGLDNTYDICLDKRIPVGAGLGGGSSDAAGMLVALRRLHEIYTTDDELARIGAEIGSDVPFFIRGGTAVVSGRGEIIRQAVWPFGFAYVIVKPAVKVSTPWAYGALRGFTDDGGAYEAMTENLAAGTLDGETFLRAMVNDFEPVVFARYPELAGIKSALIDAGALAAFMSGSGSALAGVFPGMETAERVAHDLNVPGSAVYAVQPA